MIAVTVLYPNTDGSWFDHDYYRDRHMPMVAETLGESLKGYRVERGISGAAPGDPPPFLAIGHMLFDSLEDFQRSFKPHARQLMDDIPNYTSATPTMQISETDR